MARGAPWRSYTLAPCACAWSATWSRLRHETLQLRMGPVRVTRSARCSAQAPEMIH